MLTDGTEITRGGWFSFRFSSSSTRLASLPSSRSFLDAGAAAWQL